MSSLPCICWLFVIGLPPAVCDSIAGTMRRARLRQSLFHYTQMTATFGRRCMAIAAVVVAVFADKLG